MTKTRLNLLLIAACCASGKLSYAVEPLSEESMSSISLESGSLEHILSINGSTAAGEDYIATQQETKKNVDATSVTQMEESSQRLMLDRTQVEGKQITATQINPDISSFASSTTRVASSIKGDSTSFFNPNQVYQKASLTPEGGLKIDNGAIIDRVQILNARDNHGIDRGNRYFSDIRASGSTVITGR